MKLSNECQPVQKAGETVRLRFTATNRSDENRIVSLRFATTDVAWLLAPKTYKRLGPASGYVVPAKLPVCAFADGEGVVLEVR